eukprot:gb/GFBE01037121.1/.p1 GENE.gb/GFBE01037121.1/~~gb/GFBE01037121.1/.p1  ORF type:complete len:717 (+),score=257.40 gb/GFBE01037121.1/:1-2151(+)
MAWAPLRAMVLGVEALRPWHLPLILALWAASAPCGAAEGSSNPVGKVVGLLKEIRKQVEKEGEEDEDTYDKFKCWCDENEKEKTASITFAQTRLEEKGALIQTGKAEEARLTAEIKYATKELEEDEASLQSATAQREKERASYQKEAEEARSTQAAVANALEKLQGVPEKQEAIKQKLRQKDVKEALLQVQGAVERDGAPRFRNLMQRDLFDVLGSLEDAVKPASSPSSAFLGPSLIQRYDPAAEYESSSGGIVGMLSQMSVNMQEDMAEAEKAEAEAEEEFKKLRAAKTAEIAAARQQLEQKRETAADIREKVARASAETPRLKKAVDADSEFLKQLKLDCTEEADDFAERLASRQEEVKAVGETLEILTEDSARANLMGSVGFLQLESTTAPSELEEQRVRRAAARLGQQKGSLSLLSLGMHVRLDKFGKVKEMMEKATDDLKMQQKRDQAKRDKCKVELDQIEDQIHEGKNKEAKAQRKDQAMKDTLDEVSADLEKLKEDISESEVSLQKASIERKEGNKNYQTSMADAQTTVQILKKAEARMKAFYASGSFVQVREHRVEVDADAQEPGLATRDAPQKSQDYRKAAAGGSVLQMLANVAKDAELSAQKLKLGEKRAQEVYSRLVQDTTNSINAARVAMEETEMQVAKIKSQKAEAAEASTAATAELSKLNDLLKAKHGDCDWLEENFDERKKARTEELYAIRDAKDMLSGAK